MYPNNTIDQVEESIIKPNIVFKSAILVFSFMVFVPITLALSLYTLFSVSNTNKSSSVLASKTQNNTPILSFYESSFASVDGTAQPSDAREHIIQNYLNTYNSPLSSHSKFLVETADRYELDFRLLTAIAQQESNLCKIIPEGTYNCWGWGIHSRGTLGFESFNEGIEAVSKGLREEYLDKGLTTPNEIMTKYTPLSNGSWAEAVNTFMEDME